MTGSTNSAEANIERDHPLFEVIEEAYRLFAYPTPRSTGVCERCCMDPKIECDFFNHPIRRLPLAYVQDWYAGAYNPESMPQETWGYLLPRILELLALGEDVSHTGLTVSLNRFETGNPNVWSAGQWKILDRFRREYLNRAIASGEGFLDDFVCMFRLAGWPLSGLISQVASSPDVSIVQRLWQDWCAGVIPGREDVWITGFWEGSDSSTMFKFYTSRELLQRMERLALADKVDVQLAEKAFAVASVIESKAEWSSAP